MVLMLLVLVLFFISIFIRLVIRFSLLMIDLMWFWFVSGFYMEFILKRLLVFVVINSLFLLLFWLNMVCICLFFRVFFRLSRCFMKLGVSMQCVSIWLLLQILNVFLNFGLMRLICFSLVELKDCDSFCREFSQFWLCVMMVIFFILCGKVMCISIL